MHAQGVELEVSDEAVEFLRTRASTRSTGRGRCEARDPAPARGRALGTAPGRRDRAGAGRARRAARRAAQRRDGTRSGGRGRGVGNRGPRLTSRPHLSVGPWRLIRTIGCRCRDCRLRERHAIREGPSRERCLHSLTTFSAGTSRLHPHTTRHRARHAPVPHNRATSRYLVSIHARDGSNVSGPANVRNEGFPRLESGRRLPGAEPNPRAWLGSASSALGLSSDLSSARVENGRSAPTHGHRRPRGPPTREEHER